MIRILMMMMMMMMIIIIIIYDCDYSREEMTKGRPRKREE